MAVLTFGARFKTQLQPLIQRGRTEGKQQCSASSRSLTEDYRGWGMELCFASVAPARDVCFVESGEWWPLPLRRAGGSRWDLALRDISVKFPLGEMREGRGGRVCFHRSPFHRLAGPLALTHTYMIMKCHIFHLSWGRRFKGQEQSASFMWQAERRRAQTEP